MHSLRDFWRRHRRKIFVTVGALGGGYVLYKLYDANRRRVIEWERELAEQERILAERENFIKAQMQAHFASIQRIADTTTLPHAMHYLSSRIAEELDHSELTEKLQKAKGQPNSEKLELWDRIKILSPLVQAGRSSGKRKAKDGLMGPIVRPLLVIAKIHGEMEWTLEFLEELYGEGFRWVWLDLTKENADTIDRDDEQKFLASADFLSNVGLSSLISDMLAAATEVLKGKQVALDLLDTTEFRKTIRLILERFKSIRSPNHWVNYMMPEDARFYEPGSASSTDNEIPSDISKFDQLMVETHAVLASAEFGNVVEISLKAVLDALMEDMAAQSGGSLTSGILLIKLLPRVAQMGPLLLGDPSKNQFIQSIQSVPEVELFFTLLYANMSAS
ncbi:Peroxisome biogenesis protein 3-2 [Morella rubra]|uniref:Peroxisome biogenesis protein 3-2 n=1 Tax=Morella rubra TaxID=262757 RepID=A0A6A1VK86_9ROSI|nr:Peroxisome biogenesis protein 3-2 [Morella rubra]